MIPGHQAEFSGVICSGDGQGQRGVCCGFTDLGSVGKRPGFYS